MSNKEQEITIPEDHQQAFKDALDTVNYERDVLLELMKKADVQYALCEMKQKNLFQVVKDAIPYLDGGKIAFSIDGDTGVITLDDNTPDPSVSHVSKTIN